MKSIQADHKEALSLAVEVISNGGLIVYPTDTVYGYVPVDIVTNVIVKHGGMVEGEVPPGVIPVSTVE